MDDAYFKLMAMALDAIGTSPRETSGITPMYLPVRVSRIDQPAPSCATAQVSVPCPISTAPPPSVRQALLATSQIVNLEPEGAKVNCCDGFAPIGLPFSGNASAAGGKPQYEVKKPPSITQ
jgi:hypothetical protein